MNSIRSAMAAIVVAAVTAYGQAIPPGVNPSYLADPDGGSMKKAPPAAVAANDELAVATAEYGKVHEELQEITLEQARLQREMRSMHSGSVFDPTSPFGTNDVEFVRMRAEVQILEKKLKELRAELLKRQQAMPEYKKLVINMQDASKRIQEFEKRRKTLTQDRTYLVSKMHTIKRQREEDAKKAAAAGTNSAVKAETIPAVDREKSAIPADNP